MNNDIDKFNSFLFTEDRTPLKFCLENHHYDIAHFLLMHGADCQILSHQSDLPSELQIFKPSDKLGRNGIYSIAEKENLNELQKYEEYKDIEKQVFIGTHELICRI